MPSFEDRLAKTFPGLRKGQYKVTSPIDPTYNCIAWAANDTNQCWWPGPYVPGGYFWPYWAPPTVTLEAFEAVFSGLGYEATASDSFEPGFIKIAIYADPVRGPTHACRQLPDGSWTSKLGKSIDLTHENARDVEGREYGRVALVMRKSSTP